MKDGDVFTLSPVSIEKRKLPSLLMAYKLLSLLPEKMIFSPSISAIDGAAWNLSLAVNGNPGAVLPSS